MEFDSWRVEELSEVELISFKVTNADSEEQSCAQKDREKA